MIHDANLSAVDATGLVRVWGPAGTVVALDAGESLTFGRGNGVDLVVSCGPDLSRRAGEISALPSGAWVANISHSHALYVEGHDYHVRLPPSGGDGPAGGWLLVSGTARVGSMSMMRHGMALRIDVAGHASGESPAAHPGHHKLPAHRLRRDSLGGDSQPGRAAGDGGRDKDEITVRPLQLRRDTKLFLVALLLCRPWLEDPSHGSALPTAPEIAKAALHVTDASNQLQRLERDPRFRDRMVEQVNEHLKHLRERIRASGLTLPGTRLTPAVMVGVLLANDVLTRTDLAALDTPVWRSRQEDLWWRTST